MFGTLRNEAARSRERLVKNAGRFTTMDDAEKELEDLKEENRKLKRRVQRLEKRVDAYIRGEKAKKKKKEPDHPMEVA